MKKLALCLVSIGLAVAMLMSGSMVSTVDMPP
jgi:hypothetical protein